MAGAIWRKAACLALVIGLLPSPGAADPTLDPRPFTARTAIFSSVEAGSAKLFGSIGFKHAVGGALDETGWRIFAKAASSSETSALRRDPSLSSETQLLAGREWRIGDSFLAILAGPEHDAVIDLCTCRITHRFGGRIQAELWSTPLPETMLQAGAYLSTIEGRHWGRVALGIRPGFDAYLGPEVELFRQRDYEKLRIGAHLSEVRLFGLSWRVSGGWQRATNRGGEPYGTLAVYWLR